MKTSAAGVSVASGHTIDVEQASSMQKILDAACALMRYKICSSLPGVSDPFLSFPSIQELEDEAFMIARFILEIMCGDFNNHAPSDTDVKDFLYSRCVKNANNASHWLPSGLYNGKKNDKNRVIDKIVRQRRRVHEHLTPLVIAAWMKNATGGLSRYDPLRATEKQTKSILDSAANAYEKNPDSGYCGFMEGKDLGLLSEVLAKHCSYLLRVLEISLWVLFNKLCPCRN